MINAPQLLLDLTRLLTRLEDDLRQRIADLAEREAALQAEWQAARDARRTAETFESWAEQIITQAGVHWLLSCVFIRFIEDNGLVDRPWLGGTPASGRLALARDRHEAYFRGHPLHNDREFLLAAFTETGALPGLNTFFDPAHNPVWRLGLSADGALALHQFWQQVDPNTGTLVHDFSDPEWTTRFLGDLYQDLSEATRKRYALLQTPEFVEEFILDRTLTPAIHEFGYQAVRLIDPTCGSGHFLLGAFHRLVDEWRRREPGRNPRDIAQKALDAVAGVDLNPFAVAIARFRLWVAALQVAGVQRMAEAPNFRLQVAIGDSLLHGARFGGSATTDMFQSADDYAATGLAHAYASEDLAEVQAILGRQYHAVVGNPPYIVVRDAALNAAYRTRYASCHMKYSLGAPFTERFFELALTGGDGQAAGFVGLITANSFMKREFGAKLIEQVLKALDLSHVVDTSGAYIPGHGTPTVMLFGRHRAPMGDGIRTVMGIKGEPSAPDHPAMGLVWSAIVEQIDRAGSESEFVSVADTPRATFAKHPWSIGGGGAADLKDTIEANSGSTLGNLATEMGVFGMTNADEVMLAPDAAFRRRNVEARFRRPLIVGDLVRDWDVTPTDEVLFPYLDDQVVPTDDVPYMAKWLWPCRTTLGNRATFGKSTYFEEGRPWWAWHQVALRRISTPLTITFGEIATHNHFVLDRGGKVFKQTAPVIKLTAGASEDEHLGLLGLLNSSVACFWLQQVCHNKGRPGAEVAGADERFEMRYAINASNVAEFPVVDSRPVDLAARLDWLAREKAQQSPNPLLARNTVPSRVELDAAQQAVQRLFRQQIALQEELDWRCLGLYGLLPFGADAASHEQPEPPEVALGERAFEIVLARRVAKDQERTVWFERHGSTPRTDIPPHWPADYRQVVQRRIDLIQSDERNIGLIERPEYKRRWNTPSWQSLEQDALRGWLLDRLESPRHWPRLDNTAGAHTTPALMSTARLADAARHDAEFMQVAALYTRQADFDIDTLVAELVVAESVPFLPAQRYADTGQRKRAQWEATWALQRREDDIDAEVIATEGPGWREELSADARSRFELPATEPLSEQARQWVALTLAAEIKRYQDERKAQEVGAIPVPPKYQSKDFLKTDVWRLRGGLDVPKERWVSYPGCERGADSSLPIAWAGWNHLQQATALAAYYLEMKETEGWEPTRLQALLAGLLELLPWLAQWHNTLDPVFGERMGSYYRSFVIEEARSLGFTLDELRAWKPAAPAGRRRRQHRQAN